MKMRWKSRLKSQKWWRLEWILPISHNGFFSSAEFSVDKKNPLWHFWKKSSASSSFAFVLHSFMYLAQINRRMY